MYFDGINDYLSIAGLIMSPNHTLTAWVKLDAIGTLFNIANAANTDDTNFLYFRGNADTNSNSKQSISLTVVDPVFGVILDSEGGSDDSGYAKDPWWVFISYNL